MLACSLLRLWLACSLLLHCCLLLLAFGLLLPTDCDCLLTACCLCLLAVRSTWILLLLPCSLQPGCLLACSELLPCSQPAAALLAACCCAACSLLLLLPLLLLLLQLLLLLLALQSAAAACHLLQLINCGMLLLARGLLMPCSLLLPVTCSLPLLACRLQLLLFACSLLLPRSRPRRMPVACC